MTLFELLVTLACLPCNNESTAGAYASVEVPKLHNIKLLYTHCNIMMNSFACRQYPDSQRKLEEWVMIDHDCY